LPARRCVAALLLAAAVALPAPGVAGAATGTTAKSPVLILAQANSYAKKGVAKLNVYLAVPRRYPLHEGAYWETTSIIKSVGPCKQRGRRTGEVFECPMELWDESREYAVGSGELLREDPSSLFRKGRLYVAVEPHRSEKEEDTAVLPLTTGYEVIVGYYV